MKPLKNDDQKVIDNLKRYIKDEKEYNQKFLNARQIVKKAEAERISGYDKFKRDQAKQNKSNDILLDFLTKK
jgi:hypothetical protein